MRAVFGLVLIVGIGLAGFAVYMAQGYLEQDPGGGPRRCGQGGRGGSPPVEVYRGHPGSRLWRKRSPPTTSRSSAMRNPTFPRACSAPREGELFPNGPDELRFVLRPMEPREPVLAVKVTAPGEDAGITARLGRGMRAFRHQRRCLVGRLGVPAARRPGGHLLDRPRAGGTGGDVEEVTNDRKPTSLRRSGPAVDGIPASPRPSPGPSRWRLTPQSRIASLAQVTVPGKPVAEPRRHPGMTPWQRPVQVDQRRLLWHFPSSSGGLREALPEVLHESARTAADRSPRSRFPARTEAFALSNADGRA